MNDENENPGSHSRRIPIPQILIDYCEERGLDPKVVGQRMLELFTEVYRDAANLFPDWNSWSKEEQMRFLRDGTKARLDLEFPDTEES